MWSLLFMCFISLFWSLIVLTRTFFRLTFFIFLLFMIFFLISFFMLFFGFCLFIFMTFLILARAFVHINVFWVKIVTSNTFSCSKEITLSIPTKCFGFYTVHSFSHKLKHSQWLSQIAVPIIIKNKVTTLSSVE